MPQMTPESCQRQGVAALKILKDRSVCLGYGPLPVTVESED